MGIAGATCEVATSRTWPEASADLCWHVQSGRTHVGFTVASCVVARGGRVAGTRVDRVAGTRADRVVGVVAGVVASVAPVWSQTGCGRQDC